MFLNILNFELSFSRISLGLWTLCAFVLTSGYAGNLKAFLMSPSLTKQINNMQDVLASGLPLRSIEHSPVMMMEEIADSSDRYLLSQDILDILGMIQEVPYEEFPVEEVSFIKTSKK